MKYFIRFLASFLALVCCQLIAAEKPNIVFILADDMGFGDVACYGGTIAPTPHLDRLAREGTRFTRYYSASPICSPSRCGLLTGQFPARWNITSYLQTRAGNRACDQADFLDPKAPSLPRVLKDAGYATAHIGKWHLGGGRDVADPPKFAAYGYDVGLGTYESPEPAAPLGLKTTPWAKEREPQQVARHDRTRWMVDATLAFLKTNTSKPCFVNLWLDDTHTPWTPAAPAGEAKRGRENLAAVIVEMDRQIGRLMDGVPANTLLIFATDNGALPTFDGARNTGLRGSKLSLYEGGVRLPFIARWPGRIPTARVDETSVLAAVDMLPTLAGIAGAKLAGGYTSDGEDASAALLGKPFTRAKPLFWEYGRNDKSFAFPKPPDRSPNVAVRDGKWKLLINADASGAELYDILADPDESKNIATENAETAKRLSDAALGWRKTLPRLATASLPASPRPNIVLIMPDDMGWGDIAAHGHPLIQTPHLDRLHAESVRFTDFHMSPTCAPSRSALLTGRHEFKNGVTHTIHERERMTLKATTLAQALQRAGYATGIFGKWHLGDEEAYRPDKRGFGEIFIHGAGGIGQTFPGSCGDFPGNKYFDPALLHNGTIVKTKGYCTDVFFERATEWIDATKGQPFFAMITPNAPHGPLVSPGPRYDALYEGREIGGKKLTPDDAAYLAMISNIDENLGRLLGRLKAAGIDRDTLVIFLSDNGGTHTRLFSGGFRGEKNTPYHGGTHAPSFWRWPAGFAGGADCAALTAHVDVFPTLAEIAGIKIDGELAAQVEGRSLLPLLKNPRAPWPDRTLVTHVGRWPRGQAADAKFANCSIRDARYRLVNDRELYDLESDRSETRNVIADHPDVVAKLRAAYDQWWTDVQPMLVNEDAIGPKVNPMKALYWQQFGGGPDEALRRKMDPAADASAPRPL